MDTMVSNVLPEVSPVEATGSLELDFAADKLDRQHDRAMHSVGFGATPRGMVITNNYLGAVTEAVVSKLNADSRARSNSNEFKLERLLRQIKSPELIALCLLQAGLHAVAMQATHRDVALDIGAALNDELWAAKLLQTDKKLYQRVTAHAKTKGTLTARKASAKATAERAGFSMREWSRPMLAHAGQWGMNILLEAMPDVFCLTDPQGFKGEREWTITEGGMAKADAAIAEMVVKSPVYQPREQAPADWKEFYARVAEDDRTLSEAPLLRTRHKDIIAAARHNVRNGTASPAVRAVNILQAVPWKINTWLLDVMEQCWDHNVTVPGLPLKQPFKVPPKLHGDVWNAMPIDKRRAYGRMRKGRMKANGAIKADISQFGTDRRCAQRLAKVERFYTPMNMDWRGRVYSLTHFNFTREDRIRSLFLFAEGEVIGAEGLYWLKIHVANCGAFKDEKKVGLDKKPLDDRIAWVDANMDLIRDYVKRPLANTGWTTADAPFLFLAACRELVNALTSGPANYVCHMPVSFDGSCSGLQHLAAATRAPEGRFVNLTNNESPEDVYQLVANLTKSRIEADLTSDETFGKDEKAQPVSKLARIALDAKVDRKLVKRNVMTFCYSSEEYGMSEQHFEDTMQPLELELLKGLIEEHPYGEREEEWRMMSRYLANRVLSSIKSVVELPAQAMAFMQKLAKALAHESKPLRWTSPAGLPWVNRYHEATTERVELFCYDKGVKVRTRVTVATGSEAPIDKAKAAAGVAPNLVHACDASHLLLTVCASADEGIVDIATVHDSFGCLPSRAGRFNAIIRETFMRMYANHDVLAELLASARADMSEANQWRLDEAEAAMPKKGNLDIEEIVHAKYAFA